MKPEIITKIEALWGGDFKLNLPKNQLDHLPSLMGFQTAYPKYALKDGKLVGLNLEETGLDDEKWQAIEALLEEYSVKLRLLNLIDNQLTDFALSGVTAELEELCLDGNSLDNITEETQKQGDAAVLRFLKNLQAQGERKLYEVKMLIVGEGGTGKTTLWNLLENPEHPVPDPEQESTIGIQIREAWTFDHSNQKDEFVVNLWDFGGQDIQYMTHQFFLTRRSFYVLLADGRREVANFSYWLQIIDLLGCDKVEDEKLPVLVVLNEKGNPISNLPYEPEHVKKDHPKLKIVKRDVDFAKKDGRMGALTQEIKRILCEEIPHIPLSIPKFWDEARREIYKRRESVNHLNAREFAEICVQKGITDKLQQDDLSRLLNDLGIILHFQKDIKLADFIILNPQWAVNAVYEILEHEEVKTENQGRFDEQLLQRVWTEKGYTAEEQGKLFNLMLKNNLEVCFKAMEDGKEIFIAPQLLPESKPDNVDWEENPETLRYIYHYPFMPKGIIGRLIVKLHDQIESKDGKKLVWKKGMLMVKLGEDWRAQVQDIHDKDQGRQIIKIEVQAASVEDRKRVLQHIRQALNKIHKDSFPSLKVFQKVPCNCAECCESVSPYEHDYDNLEKNIAKNGDEAKAQCQKSYENVPAKALLEGVLERGEHGLNPNEKIVEEVRKHVEKNKLGKALKCLGQVVPNHLRDEHIMLEGKLARLRRSARMAIVDSSSERLDGSQISKAILDLCNELLEEIDC